jgi:hypothetical protein
MRTLNTEAVQYVREKLMLPFQDSTNFDNIIPLDMSTMDLVCV